MAVKNFYIFQVSKMTYEIAIEKNEIVKIKFIGI